MPKYKIPDKVKNKATGQVMVVMGYIGDMVDCMWIDMELKETKRGTFDESELEDPTPYVDYNPDIQ